tara:strand:+ start:42 stop:500 length:459 start_codon:yes stop_codon:yes gene_type:complete
MAKRALVSNRGDGNWPTAGANENRLAANGSAYFPPGTGGAAPTSEQDLTNSINFSGWENKSNWIVQANLISGTSCTIAVYAMRPTEVEELVVAAVTLDSTATPPVNSFTWGGNDTETIVGPVSHFRFLMASAAGSPRVDCHVIGWNEGDIIT